MSRSTIAAALIMFVASRAFAGDAPNTLTAKEIADGWILLFDGESTFGWKTEGDVAVKDGWITLGGEKPAKITHDLIFANNLEFKAEYVGPPKHFFRRIDDPKRMPIALDLPAGLTAKARSIKVRPKNMQSLLNGKDLTGWHQHPMKKASQWTVEDGILRVRNGPGDLQTDEQWADFLLQAEIKTHGKALNSGIFFRCIPGDYQNGYEAQIQNGFKDGDRTKPADFGTGAIYRRVPTRKVVADDNEWFTMTVAAQGNRIMTWVNGYPTVDWTDDRAPNNNPRNGSKTGRGAISLQGHDPTTDISFQSIRLAELPEPPKSQ